MKSINLFIFISLLFAQSSIIALSQQNNNLLGLPVSERDKRLVSIAKETFKKQMPDIYREYGTPKIEKIEVKKTPVSYEESFYGEQKGDIYFIVTLPMDPIKEKDFFTDGFAALIHIWADTGKAFLIEYGHLEGAGEILYKRERRY